MLSHFHALVDYISAKVDQPQTCVDPESPGISRDLIFGVNGPAVRQPSLLITLSNICSSAIARNW
jgi:hypothetical protein